MQFPFFFGFALKQFNEAVAVDSVESARPRLLFSTALWKIGYCFEIKLISKKCQDSPGCGEFLNIMGRISILRDHAKSDHVPKCGKYYQAMRIHE